MTGEVRAPLKAKNIGTATFQTCVGPGHSLYAAAKAGKTLEVAHVLQSGFVSPSSGFLGHVGEKQSVDGWRDDQFPRRIEFVTSSLKLLEDLLMGGKAIAYIPDYLAKRWGAPFLKITGCPYNCSQKIKMLAKKPEQLSYLNFLF